jgi:hypothetical protein
MLRKKTSGAIEPFSCLKGGAEGPKPHGTGPIRRRLEPEFRRPEGRITVLRPP